MCALADRVEAPRLLRRRKIDFAAFLAELLAHLGHAARVRVGHQADEQRQLARVLSEGGDLR